MGAAAGLGLGLGMERRGEPCRLRGRQRSAVAPLRSALQLPTTLVRLALQLLFKQKQLPSTKVDRILRKVTLLFILNRGNLQ